MNLTLAPHTGRTRAVGNAITLVRGTTGNVVRTRSSTMRTESRRSAVSSQVTGLAPEDGASGEFGANEWLVDEMYERYLVDKESVDKSWWPILENYKASKDAVPTPAAEPAAPADTASTPTGSTPIARTTSIQAKPQPIPAQAPSTEGIA